MASPALLWGTLGSVCPGWGLVAAGNWSLPVLGSFEGFVAAHRELAILWLLLWDHQRAQGQGCGHLVIAKEISKANIEKCLGGGSWAGILERWEPPAAGREKCLMFSWGWHMKGGLRSLIN